MKMNIKILRNFILKHPQLAVITGANTYKIFHEDEKNIPATARKRTDENIYVEFVYEILQHVENCFFGMVVRTLEGYPVFTSETNYLQSNQNGEKFKASCVIPAQFLNQGIFTINLHFVESKTFSKLPFEAGFKILFKKESNKDIPLYFGPVKPVIRWQSEKLI